MIIGLTGAAGSGKSEVAKFLIEEHGFETLKFAGPLKDMLRSFYRGLGLNEGQIEDRLEGILKDIPDPLLNGKSPRYAMQTLGTEWGRNCMNQAFWVDAWSNAAVARGGKIVTDDCRFPNEARALRKLGGRVLQIVRPGQQKLEGDHSSEAGLLDKHVDVVVWNLGTKQDLRERVEFVV